MVGPQLQCRPEGIDSKGSERARGWQRASDSFDKWMFIFLLNHAGAPEQLTRLSAGGKNPRQFSASDVNTHRFTMDHTAWRRWIFEGVLPEKW